MTRIALILLLALVASPIKAFCPSTRLVTRSGTRLSYGRLNNRWFQLEEMEDQDSCTTEVRLNEDLSVEVADTNGPLFTAAEGSWFLSEDDGSFTMTLKRTYEAGQPNTSDATAVGPFSFSLYRTFNGGVGMVGDRASVEGKITDEQTSDKELGYFQMIDTTKEMKEAGYELRGRPQASGS